MGLQRRRHELEELINRIKPRIILISKSHHKQDETILTIPNHTGIAENINNQRFGGVAIYIHKTMLTKNIPITNTEAIFETSSDHNPAIFEIITSILKLHNKPIRVFKRADWKGFREEINKNLQTNREVHSAVNIENKVAKITRIIKEATENNIPAKKCGKSNRNLPKKVEELIRERNCTRRRFQRTRGEEWLNQ